MKLRLVWPKGEPPEPKQIRDCGMWRESYVFQRVRYGPLYMFVRRAVNDGRLTEEERKKFLIDSAIESNTWPCEFLKGTVPEHILQRMHEKWFHPERDFRCGGGLCCGSMVVALGKILETRAFDRWDPDFTRDVVIQYRELTSAHSNNILFISKDRYRTLRCLGAPEEVHDMLKISVGD